MDTKVKQLLHDVVSLHEQNIHVMCHAGRLRVAIHGYNTAEDVERLLKELRAALGKV